MQNQNDLERAIASQKSYVTSAIIIFFLYWICYLPGLIFNLMYVFDADKVIKVTGKYPSGYGCLVIMFLIGLIPLVIYGIILFTSVAVLAPSTVK